MTDNINRAQVACVPPGYFTWEMVDQIRAAAEQLPTFGGGPGGEDIPDPELSRIADLIAALLPPRQP